MKIPKMIAKKLLLMLPPIVRRSVWASCMHKKLDSMLTDERIVELNKHYETRSAIVKALANAVASDLPVVNNFKNRNINELIYDVRESIENTPAHLRFTTTSKSLFNSADFYKR